MAAQFLGAHVPTGKGLHHAIMGAQEIGCTSAQVFTSSPRMWKSAFPTDEKIAAFKDSVRKAGIDQLISHDSYLVNLCHVDEAVAEKSAEALKDEISRASALGIPLVVSHMGALVGQDEGVGQRRIAEKVRRIVAETSADVVLCMETTAGQGTSINWKFEQIAALLDLIDESSRLAVCLDTCHVFAAGYDIRTEEGTMAMLSEFDRLVGLDLLKVLHLNDSKKGLGSRVDRHANIGEGEIGLEAFRALVNDPRLESTPMVIETPTENDGHSRDIKTLRSLFKSA